MALSPVLYQWALATPAYGQSNLEPEWWSERGALDPDASAQHLAVVNGGQLKWIATQLYDEMQTLLPAGAGFELDSVFAAPKVPFDSGYDDWVENQHVPVNLGQAKHVAHQYFKSLNQISPQWVREQLIQSGLDSSVLDAEHVSTTLGEEGYYYPWTDLTGDDDNYAMVNQGQVKVLFALRTRQDSEADPDGLPDIFEHALMAMSDAEYASYIGTPGAINPFSSLSGIDQINWDEGSLNVSISTGGILQKTPVPVPATGLANANASIASLLTEHEAVGSVSGAFEVSGDGSAVYTVPIDLPAGTAGMAPKLSVAYSSHGGNGSLGVGFEVSGLQRITRGPANIKDDNLVDGVDFDANDRFFLDGERLVCVSGTYGLDGAEYRTQSNTFARVKSHGQLGSGPAYWEVETKSGLTLYFGGCPNGGHQDSCVNAPEDANGVTRGALVWGICQAVDPVGNYYTVEYERCHTCANGESAIDYRPSKIRYTGNHNTGDLPYNLIEFVYEERNDTSSGFMAGVKLQTTKRLAEIKVAYAPSAGAVEQLLTTYGFDYLDENVELYPNGWSDFIAAHVSGKSTLQRIYQVNGITGELLSPIEFTWTDLGGGKGLQYSAGLNSYISNDSSKAKVDMSRVKFGDFNGDGLMDIYNILGHDSTAEDKIHFASKDSTGKIEYLSSISALNTYVGADLDRETRDVGRYRLLDLNGDGMTDIYYLYGSGSTQLGKVYISNGDGTFEFSDGVTLYTSSDAKMAQIDMTRIKFGDFNGDGLMDIYKICGSDSTTKDLIYLSAVNSSGKYGYSAAVESLNTWVGSQGSRESRDISRYKLLDLNGDGMTDIYYLRGGSTRAYISMGDGTFQSNIGVNLYISSDSSMAKIDMERIKFGDFNGDGIIDVYKVEGHESTTVDKIYLASATSHGEYDCSISVSALNTYVGSGGWRESRDLSSFQLLDLNGDGLTDVYYLRGDSSHAYISRGDGTFQSNDGVDFYMSTDPGMAEIDMGRIKFGDFNGDGLIDIYQVNGSESTTEDKIYLASTAASGKYEYSSSISALNTYVGSMGSKESRDIARINIIDLTGDGISDIYDFNGSDENKVDGVYASKGRKPYITGFTDGLGAEIKVEYQRMNEPTSDTRKDSWGGHSDWKVDTYTRGTDTATDLANRISRVNSSRLLVSRYAEQNGAGGFRWKRHHYEGWKVDRKNNVSLHFEKITVIDEDRNQKRVSNYRQDYPFQGKLDSTQASYYNPELGQEICISGEEHFYDQWTPQVPAQDPHTEISFLYGKQSIGYRCNSLGQRISATFTEQSFPEDQFGHLATSTVVTIPYSQSTPIAKAGANYTLSEVEGARSAGDWQKVTTTNLYNHDASQWHLGRLSSASVTKSLFRADGTSDSITKNSAFGYYANGMLHTEKIEPGTAFETTTSKEYDAYGNVSKQSTTTFDGTGGTLTRFATSSYTGGTNGEQPGRFLISTSNQLGHTSSNVYNPVRSLLLSSTGINGLTTKFYYDDWGTKVLTRTPDHLESGEVTKWATPADIPSGITNGAAPFDTAPEITFIRKTQSSGGPPAVLFIDSQGRQVMSCTRTLKSVSADGFPTYATVYQRTAYDAKGRKFAESLPFFADEEILFSYYTFDHTDRLLETHHPDGAYDSAEYNYGGNPLATLMRNRKGLYRIRVDNVLGQSVESCDCGTATTPGDQNVKFTFNANGNTIQADTVGNNTITTYYDILGRKTGMSDPDAGDSWIKYNGFGETIALGYGPDQATGTTTQTATFDVLGRPLTTTTYHPSGAVEYHTTTSYDIAGWLGAAAGVEHYKDATSGAENLISSSTPVYDHLGRGVRTYSTVLGQSYSTSVSYDALGRVRTETDAGGLTVLHQYTADSFEVGLINYRDGTVYYRPREFDSGGRVTQEQLGNGVVTTRTYQRTSGLLQTIDSVNGSTVLQDLSFGWDNLANLRYRENSRINRHEQFSYDGLNRLTGSEVDTGVNPYATHTSLNTEPTLAGEAYSYDATGNLLNKPGILIDANSYSGHRLNTYQRGGKNHQLLYDSRGRAVQELRDGTVERTFGYTSFGQLATVTKTGSLEMTESGIARQIQSASAEFEFGAGLSRLRSIKTETFDNGEERKTTTTYLGNVETVHLQQYLGINALKKTETTKHYLGGLAIVEQVKDLLAAPNAPPTQSTKYLLKDHLGSTETVTDQDGLVVEHLSFDAWGQQRDAITWGEADSITYGKTRSSSHVSRGFTGHEQFDSLGIIHMNGRVYDATLGRFFSPDPAVQAPDRAQNYNRYIYVLNNPLSYTDPSGYFFKKIWKAIVKVVSAVISPVVKLINKAGKWLAKNGLLGVVSGIITIIGFATGNPFAVMAASAINTALAGGSAEDVLKGALIEGAMMVATAGLHNLGTVAKGGMQAAQAAGTASGAVVNAAKAIHNVTRVSYKVLHAAAHGVLGGVTNTLMGGKFKDGFISAAAGAYAGTSGLIGKIAGSGVIPNTVSTRTAIAGVIGGTVSEVSGGKFANGAYSAAFGHLFNTENALANFLAEHDGIRNGIANFMNGFAGFADGISFGASKRMSDAMYGAGQWAPQDDSYYVGGEVTGVVASTLASGGSVGMTRAAASGTRLVRVTSYAAKPTSAVLSSGKWVVRGGRGSRSFLGTGLWGGTIAPTTFKPFIRQYTSKTGYKFLNMPSAKFFGRDGNWKAYAFGQFKVL